jgi:hypothetical protein
MRLKVKNWSEFQHYKNRTPPWLKLHRGLLDDFEWHRLPDASRALAPMLWLLASEFEDGTIDASSDELAFRLHTTGERLDEALKPLIKAGFFVLEQSDSNALAERKQDACSESEEEREKEGEGESEGKVASATPLPEPDLDLPLPLDRTPEAEALKIWNETAERIGLPIAQRLTDPRRKALKTRLSESGGIDGWKAALAKLEASSFLTGKTGRGEGHENWRCDLDFILRQNKFTKLMEGGFDDTPSTTRTDERGLGAVLAELGRQSTRGH